MKKLSILRSVHGFLGGEFLVRYKRDSSVAINTAITAKAEEHVKQIICPRIPLWVNPDMLTALGYVGILISSAGFVLGFSNKYFLLLIPLGLFINWFGDCFDGSIARYRNISRPNYGYFIDKIVDAIGVVTLAFGIGLSGFVRMDVIFIFTSVYLMLMFYVDLVVHIDGEVRNAFGLFGPTEIRIIGCIFTLYMSLSELSYMNIFDLIFTQYDVFVLVLTLVMLILLLVSVYKKAVELNAKDSNRLPR